jgi:hypothetical protein
VAGIPQHLYENVYSTPKVVYDLAKAGVIERGPARLFPLEESVRRYCEHLRRQTGVSPDLVCSTGKQAPD